MNGTSLASLLDGVIPAEVIQLYTRYPVILYIGGGLATAGICNVFLLGNVVMNQFGLSPIFFFLIMMMFPTYVIMIGILAVPVMLAVSLYGWISLSLSNKGRMRQKNLSSDEEIIRIYKIHHPLMEEYKDMAVQARKTIRKISWIYSLGIVAVFCVMFFIDNLFVSIIAIFLYMFAFQYLTRLKNQCFMPISNLLYVDCNPEACMSALIYYCQRGKDRYKLSNQALMANCLIYMDDPSLAQDVLISYPRASYSSSMNYWSLMAYTYYLLKDRQGLERCKEAIDQMRPSMGQMGVMIKSEQQQAVDNKINLMNRDFTACKQYYLDRLKKSPAPLQQADCYYYIALISFVQEDYPIAEMYFEKTIKIGNKLYFVRNARNYLEKIQAMGIDSARELTY